jgi:hypothetical protein
MALLVMDQLGFSFGAHFQRVHGTRGPDFIVQEKGSATRALVEAKGTFATPGKAPNIKGMLGDGLRQLSSCSVRGVRKSFVVGTVLREVGDSYPEPSLVTLVDPDLEDGSLEVSPDWVIRENYAGWLRAMGLFDAASDFRGGISRELGEPVSMWPVEIAGVEFLLVPLYLPWPGPPFDDAYCIVLGLQRAIAESLQTALRDHRLALLDLFTLEMGREPTSGAIEGDWLEGSLMGDGSFLGIIRLELLLLGGAPEEIQL